MRTVTSAWRIPRIAACAALCCAALHLAAPPARAGTVVGLIMPQCCDFGEETKFKFAASLQQAGIKAGDVEILVQRPSIDKVSLINSIRKLLAYEAKALVVFGGTTAREAMLETGAVPIVFIGAYDPVGQELARTVEKPGLNATGVTCRTSLAFLLDNLHETLPLQSLGVIYHSDNLDSKAQLADLNDLAAKRNIRIVSGDLKRTKPGDLATLFGPVQFIYLASGCYPDFLNGTDLNRLGKPLATQCQQAESINAVFSLAADAEEAIVEGGRLTARILQGQKPGDLAVISPKTIQFIINMTAAQSQGLKIPFGVLNRATKIIK